MKTQIIRFGVVDKQGDLITPETKILLPKKVTVTVNFDPTKAVGIADNFVHEANGIYADVHVYTAGGLRDGQQVVFRPGLKKSKSFEILEISMIPRDRDVY